MQSFAESDRGKELLPRGQLVHQDSVWLLSS